MLSIGFVKASGAGNDFVVLNNMDGRLPVPMPPLARALCDRHVGIGADGLLVLEPSTVADLKMLYFNADGSFGGMCGNGGRCVALAAYLSNLAGRRCRIEALDFVYTAEIGEGSVRLSMKDPVGYRSDILVKAGGNELSCYSIDTGAPHAVVFVPDLEALDVESLGKSMRHSLPFQPAGTNVNFARLLAGSEIAIRTYERGVEAETLACGTGSIAAAAISAVVHGRPFPIDVRVRSGATLRIHGRRSGTSISDVVLEGPAEILFSGSVHYEGETGAIVALDRTSLMWGSTPGRK